jgi:hypothetical protein
VRDGRLIEEACFGPERVFEIVPLARPFGIVNILLFVVGLGRKIGLLAHGGGVKIGMTVVENCLKVFRNLLGNLGRIHYRVDGFLALAVPVVVGFGVTQHHGLIRVRLIGRSLVMLFERLFDTIGELIERVAPARFVAVVARSAFSVRLDLVAKIFFRGALETETLVPQVIDIPARVHDRPLSTNEACMAA